MIRNINLVISNLNSRNFRILFLLCIILNELIFYFDFSTLSVRTSANIIYDFSGSWRNHIARYLAGERLYEDFYYPYPPIGFYIMSCIFSLSGENIINQTIATSIVAVGIHCFLFLIIEKYIKDKSIKTIVLITSLFFLLGSNKHEIYLGGNPFPLVLGLLFFLSSIYFHKRTSISLILILISASCKHEFWLGSILIIIIHFKNNYKISTIILSLFIALNLIIGYSSYEIISGMGRSNWARWNFNWKNFIPQLIMCFPLLFYRNKWLLIFTSILCIFVIQFLFKDLVKSFPIFFIFIFYFLINIKIKKEHLYLFLILLSLQFRRGFEWSEFTFDCLSPIFLSYTLLDTSGTRKRKGLALLTIILILSVHRYYFASHNSTIKVLSNYDKFDINHTNIGDISTRHYLKEYVELIREVKNITEGEPILTFPFCPGISLLTGSYYTSPVSYFYNRSYIKTFDYYGKNLGEPQFIILDNRFLSWQDYPQFQNSLFKWELDRHYIDLYGQYPEISSHLEENFILLKEISHFSIYQRANK